MPAGKQKLMFIKANSLNDLCRFACLFDESNVLFADEHRIVAFGEKLNDIQLAYYVEQEAKGKIINYSLPYEGNAEKAEFSDTAEYPVQTTSNCTINVLRVDLGGMPLCTKQNAIKNVTTVKFESLLDLIKGIVRKFSKSESVPYVYSFKINGASAFGAFDVIDELADDTSIFYSAMAADEGKPFIRYDYKTDTIEFANEINEHAYFYIRVIRLAEAFPFLSTGKAKLKNKSK